MVECPKIEIQTILDKISDEVIVLAKALAEEPEKKERIKPHPEEIIALVAEEYKLSPTEMKSKRRFPQVVVPRQVAMWAMKEYTPLSWAQIGGYFNKDHSTVIHSRRIVETCWMKDPRYPHKEKIEKLKDILDQWGL